MGSIARPFRWNAGSGADGAGLKEMSDTDLEYLSYYFRLYYATQLATGHAGSIVYAPGSTHATTHPQIGSVFMTLDSTTNPDTDNWHFPASAAAATDKRKNKVTDYIANNDTGGPGTPENAPDPGDAAFQATLAVRQSWRTLMTKRHANDILPGLPSTATYDSDGYIVQNGAGNFQIDNTVANIAHTILKHSNTEMLSGDELGTYRVATSAPGPVASDWTVIDGASNNEYMFQDSIMTYTASTPGTEGTSVVTNYKLWLKTSFTFAGETSAALTEPFGWDTGNGGSLKQKPITDAHALVQDILYPIYVQQSFADIGGYGYPIYSWDSNSAVAGAWEVSRGTVNDTYYNASSLRGAQSMLAGGTYYADRYGTPGSFTTVPWYFKLTLPGSTYLR